MGILGAQKITVENNCNPNRESFKILSRMENIFECEHNYILYMKSVFVYCIRIISKDVKKIQY